MTSPDAGAELPEPFTDAAAVFPLVRPAGSTPAHDGHDQARRHRTAPEGAGPPALVDTFHHAAGAFDDRRAELISELRRRWLE
jgi:hypothetical protein